MELNGRYDFDAPRSWSGRCSSTRRCWRVLCPAASDWAYRRERIRRRHEDPRWAGQGTFQGSVQLSELQPPQSCHMLVSGRGPAGIVRGEGDVRLRATGAATVMHYKGEAQISGRIATVGQRLMETRRRPSPARASTISTGRSRPACSRRASTRPLARTVLARSRPAPHRRPARRSSP